MERCADGKPRGLVRTKGCKRGGGGVVSANVFFWGGVGIRVWRGLKVRSEKHEDRFAGLWRVRKAGALWRVPNGGGTIVPRFYCK